MKASAVVLVRMAAWHHPNALGDPVIGELGPFTHRRNVGTGRRPEQREDGLVAGNEQATDQRDPPTLLGQLARGDARRIQVSSRGGLAGGWAVTLGQEGADGLWASGGSVGDHAATLGLELPDRHPAIPYNAGPSASVGAVPRLSAIHRPSSALERIPSLA